MAPSDTPVDPRAAPTEDGRVPSAVEASPRRSARAQTDATLRDVGGALTTPHDAITHKELPNPERQRLEPTVQTSARGGRRWRVAVALVVVLAAGAATVFALV